MNQAVTRGFASPFSASSLFSLLAYKHTHTHTHTRTGPIYILCRIVIYYASHEMLENEGPVSQGEEELKHSALTLERQKENDVRQC